MLESRIQTKIICCIYYSFSLSLVSFHLKQFVSPSMHYLFIVFHNFDIFEEYMSLILQTVIFIFFMIYFNEKKFLFWLSAIHWEFFMVSAFLCPI